MSAITGNRLQSYEAVTAGVMEALRSRIAALKKVLCSRIVPQALPGRTSAHLFDARAPVLQRQDQPAPPVDRERVRTQSDADPGPLRAFRVAAQALALRSVGEHARRGLGEDSGALQRPQQSVEAGSMGLAALGENSTCKGPPAR